jgi:hypothetical protein
MRAQFREEFGVLFHEMKYIKKLGRLTLCGKICIYQFYVKGGGERYLSGDRFEKQGSEVVYE